MSKKKDRSIKKYKKKHDRHVKKSLKKSFKKSYKRKDKKKKSKSKTLKKGQKGGMILPALGVGLAATAFVAAAYKGYRLINKIHDKSNIISLLNQPFISYSPKVIITETSEFMNHYLECVTTTELFQIILENPKYLNSTTLQKIVKNSSNDEIKSREKINKDSSQFSELSNIISRIESKYDDKTILEKLRIKPDKIEDPNRTEEIKELSNLLLLTARIPGSGLDETNIDDKSEEIKKLKELGNINPYISVNSFEWMNVIITGLYDEYFSDSVNEILNERGVNKLLDNADKDRINKIIEQLSYNLNFKESIRKKMLECASKPRGYLDFVSPSISWDSQKKCLSCPEEDCLLYLYDFYYKFLKDKSVKVQLVDRLYSLMICEARICVLSKCLGLEAIRVQEKRDGRVRSIIDKIYHKDKQLPGGLTNTPPTEIWTPNVSNIITGGGDNDTVPIITSGTTIDSTQVKEKTDSSSTNTLETNANIDTLSQDVTAEATQDVTAQATQDMTAQATQDMTAQATQDMTAEATQDMTAQATQDMTAEATQVMTAPTTQVVTAEATQDMGDPTTQDVTAPAATNPPPATQDIGASTTQYVTASSEMMPATTTEMMPEATTEMMAEVTTEMMPEATTEMKQGETQDEHVETSNTVDVTEESIKEELLKFFTESGEFKLNDYINVDVTDETMTAEIAVQKFTDHDGGNLFKLLTNLFREYPEEQQNVEKKSVSQQLLKYIEQNGIRSLDLFSPQFLMKGLYGFEDEITGINLRDLVRKLLSENQFLRAKMINIIFMNKQFREFNKSIDVDVGGDFEKQFDEIVPKVDDEFKEEKTESTVPAIEALESMRETSTPKSDFTMPESETSTPKSEITMPESETSTLKSETSTPKSEITMPESEITMLESEITMLESETATPMSETATPISHATTTDSTNPELENKEMKGGSNKYFYNDTIKDFYSEIENIQIKPELFDDVPKDKNELYMSLPVLFMKSMVDLVREQRGELMSRYAVIFNSLSDEMKQSIKQREGMLELTVEEEKMFSYKDKSIDDVSELKEDDEQKELFEHTQKDMHDSLECKNLQNSFEDRIQNEEKVVFGEKDILMMERCRQRD